MKEWIRMQGLPRGDGTVLANNGVWASGNSGEKAMVSPNTIESAARRKSKRRSANVNSVFTRTGNFFSESAAASASVSSTDETTDSTTPPSTSTSSSSSQRTTNVLIERRGLLDSLKDKAKSLWRKFQCKLGKLMENQTRQKKYC
jgi:hypothetical protein